MGFRYVPAKFNRTRSFEASIIDNKAGSPPLNRRRYFDVYADPIALRNCEHLCWLKRAGWRGNPGVASLRIRTMSTGISSWGWGTRVGKYKYVALVLNRTTVLLTTFVEKLSAFS